FRVRADGWDLARFEKYVFKRFHGVCKELLIADRHGQGVRLDPGLLAEERERPDPLIAAEVVPMLLPLAVRVLPRAQLDAFVARYRLGLRVSEIAALFGVKAPTVSRNLKAAERRLQKEVA